MIDDLRLMIGKTECGRSAFFPCVVAGGRSFFAYLAYFAVWKGVSATEARRTRSKRRPEVPVRV
jgi:hypothetical protein